MKRIKGKIIGAVAVALMTAAVCMSGCGASEASSVEQETFLVTEQVVQSETAPESTAVTMEFTQESEAETIIETEAVTETDTQAKSTTEENQDTEQPKQEKTAQEPVPAAEGSVSADDYAVILQGLSIPLGADMRSYADLLGDPDGFASAKSCVEAGDDKVYTYGGVMIYTYITNGADIISLIEVTGSEVLPSGIHIGSTKEEVIAAFGSSYTEDGTELLYELGNKTIGLQITDNKVSFMELFGQ